MIHPLEFYAEYYYLNAEGRFDPPRILGAADVLQLRLLPELRQSLGDLLGWPAPEAGIAPSPTTA